MLSQLGHLPMDFLLLAAAVALASFGFIAGRLRAEHVFLLRRHPSQLAPECARILRPDVEPGAGGAGGARLHVFFSEGTSRAILRSELPDGFSILTPGELTTYLDTVARAARIPDFLSGERVFDTVTERYGEIRATVNIVTLAFAMALSLAGMFSRTAVPVAGVPGAAACRERHRVVPVPVRGARHRDHSGHCCLARFREPALLCGSAGVGFPAGDTLECADQRRVRGAAAVLRHLS
jgi:hypothetical protein